MAQLPSGFFKYWVLTLMPDEEGEMYEARPLGSPPNWEGLERGWQGFDFREDGKFSYMTFLPNDPRVELDGSWKLDTDSGRIRIEIPDTDEAGAISLAGSGWRMGKAASFTLEIVDLDEEMLKVRILEEQPPEADIVNPGDVSPV